MRLEFQSGKVPKSQQLLVQRGFLYGETKVSIGTLRVKPKISVLQANAKSGQKGECLTSYQVLSGVKFCYWKFFHVVKLLHPVMVLVCEKL